MQQANSESGIVNEIAGWNPLMLRSSLPKSTGLRRLLCNRSL